MRALSRLLLVFFALLFVSSSAFAQTLREFILVIGEDDQLDEPSLRLALSLADATAERVVDGPAASASPVLNGAYVVTVPAHKAVTLVELLSLDVENVALIEDNVRVFAPPQSSSRRVDINIGNQEIRNQRATGSEAILQQNHAIA